MYLVSSCLAGINCRYDGGNSRNEEVMRLLEEGQAVLVCPEQLGGLPTPRPCCEMQITTQKEIVIKSKDGQEFTKEFLQGAEQSLAIAKAFGIKKAILKAKSPSCGYGKIYDGTFTGRLIDGNGLLAELLLKNGLEVSTEK